MRKLFFLILTSCTLFLQAQEKPIIISGQVFVNEKGLQDVHIINETSELGTITNDDGNFEILAQKGDLLLISHLNYEIQQHIVTNEDLLNKKIVLKVTNKTYILDEVVVKKNKGVFEVDKDIMPHNLPEVNAKTLHLPYAESEKVKEEKLLKIQSGLAVNLDGLLNVLSGNHKKEKELKEIQLSDDNLLAIRNHFSDSFFTNQLQVEKEYINVFLNYNASSGIIRLYQKNKFLQLTSILLENSKTFSHKNTEDETELSLK